MTEDNKELRRLKDLFAKLNMVDAPTVDLIEPEVRTAMKFPTRLRRTRDIDNRIRQGRHIGAFVVEWGYDVDNDEAFQRWLRQNEQALSNSSPDDVEYRGTYRVVISSEKEGGEYRTFWAFESMAAMEELGARKGRFGTLLRAFNRFRSKNPNAKFSQQILQTAAATSSF